MPLPAKLLTTGQFGVDLGALRAGRILGIPTGGVMPREFMTQRGPRPWYDTQFGMRESPSAQLLVCRIDNIMAAHVSLIFGTVASAGARKAFIEPCVTCGRPFFVNPALTQLRFMGETFPPDTVIHVLGNREESNRGIEQYVTALLVDAWADLASPLVHDKRRQTAPYPQHLPKLPTWTGA